MDEETMWIFIKAGTFVSLCSGALVWFLLPKKWIVWSKTAADILPQETIPPWKSLNKFGKTLYMVFVGSIGLTLVMVLIGAISE